MSSMSVNWSNSMSATKVWMKNPDTFILDEDKLLDVMEPIVGGAGGCVVDFPHQRFSRKDGSN